MSRILVVGPSWVGDMVMAQSLFKLLKLRDANCKISVLAPAWTEPVLSRMPEVEQSISMPIGHGRLGLGQRWRLGRSMKDQFDQSIVMPGSFKSALVPAFAGIKQRTGFSGEMRMGLLNDRRVLNKSQMPYHLQRIASFAGLPNTVIPALEDIPWPSLEVNKSNQERLANEFSLKPNHSILALCPGAEFGPAKQWPSDHFAAVAKNRLAKGWQVIILGSEKDQKISAEIMSQTPGCKDLTGWTSLGDVIDILAMTSHVVTNDSGLMHIAAAVDCHVIAIYGSSTDDYTPPLARDANRLYLDLPCRPCFQRECPLGHTDCLHKLPASRVVDLF